MVSDKFTESRAASIATALFGVLGILLASGSLFPISAWFCDFACFIALACFLLMSRAGLGRAWGLVVMPGLIIVLYLCLLVQAPALRLALLAWVFMSEFWVERYSGGKPRGGSEALMLMAMAACCGFWLAASGRRSGPYIAGPGLRAIARFVSMPLPGVVAFEFIAACVAAVLLALAAKSVGPRIKSAGWPAAACGLVTALTLARTLSCPLPGPAAEGVPGPVRSCSVALFSRGLLDWEVPSREKFGIIRSGMFGLFRTSLERSARLGGGDVVEVDSVTTGALAAADLAVFINPDRRLAAAEQSALAAFVREGGGLLVLGDHTDLGHSRAPLNDVLRFTSIRFNFDSAISLRERWHGCLELMAHPVTRGVSDASDTQLGIGASLELAGRAFAIVEGRHAFSDAGDYDNRGRGAFMGNCRHDAGEALGGIALVAGEEVGSGRVLVFGDTSPFQNGAHFLSQRLISNSIGWVSGGFGPAKGGADVLPDFRPYNEYAFIDFGHGPEIARDLFTNRSIGGLANSLYRARITPVPSDGGDTACPRLDGAALIFLIAPTRRLRDDYVGRLAAYMRSGGHIVVAKGYTPAEPCRALFDMMRLTVEPAPLGGGDSSAGVVHRDAWGIACRGPIEAKVRARAFGRSTIMTVREGAGSFTLIADGRFLLDDNLEGEIGAVPENIEFLTALFDDLRGEGCDLARTNGVVAGNHTD